jgi:hypothetical protein
MRILHASVLLASLAILGPHAETLAQQSATTETIPAEEPKAPAGERDGYLQMARTEMRDWQLRLERFNEKAAAHGQRTAQATERALDAAWAETEGSSRELRSASAEGWAVARNAYEKSAQALVEAWDNAHPNQK